MNRREDERDLFASRSSAVFAVSAFLIVILLSLWLGHSLSRDAAAAERISSVSEPVCYRSVEIRSGDTLWSIADREAGGEKDRRTWLIGEIRRINSLDSDTIHAGSYLIIPA